MNVVQNGGFSATLRNGDGRDMLHDWRLRFYVCLRLRGRCSALTATAVATHWRRRISKRWHVVDIKNFTGDHQVTLMVDRNSTIYFFYVYEIATNAPAAAPRLMAASGDRSTAHSRRQKHRQERSWSIKIPQIRKLMPTKSSKTSRKTSFCFYKRRRYWWHCSLFFPTITRNSFCSHLRKIISRRPLTPPKNRDIHIVVFFVDSIYSKTRYYKKKI